MAGESPEPSREFSADSERLLASRASGGGWDDILILQTMRKDMIDASMLLHMISALDTLEKMFQGKRVGNTRQKSENGSLSKKPAGPNTGRERELWTRVLRGNSSWVDSQASRNSVAAGIRPQKPERYVIRSGQTGPRPRFRDLRSDRFL